MALEKVRDILRLVDKQNTAVIAFDAMDFHTISAVILGAEAAQKPVIAMLYPAMERYCPFRVFAETVKTLAARVRVPVGLHLDHCSDFEMILSAIRDGFSSVMADGSTLPLAENIRFTRSVVRAASVFGVDVEGELGHVGSGMQESDYDDTEQYTTVADARAFTEETGVASLAIAIGSAHGVYKKEPKLDIQRLREINDAVATPLVLHGGSGIPEDQLRQAFTGGINKFNVGTEFFHLNTTLTREAVEKADPKNPLFGMADYIQGGLTAYIEKKLALCTATV